eukprot:scaffold54688_cov31-Tisochrysis_lutea.AAC.3
MASTAKTRRRHAPTLGLAAVSIMLPSANRPLARTHLAAPSFTLVLFPGCRIRRAETPCRPLAREKTVESRDTLHSVNCELRVKAALPRSIGYGTRAAGGGSAPSPPATHPAHPTSIRASARLVARCALAIAQWHQTGRHLGLLHHT